MVAAAYSSIVIVACLVPSPPPVGRGLWSFWLTPPACVGAVCSTEVWHYGMVAAAC